MSLMYAQQGPNARFDKPFCELNLDATQAKCFRDYRDWCCNGTTSFYEQAKEFIHVFTVPSEYFHNLTMPRPSRKPKAVQ